MQWLLGFRKWLFLGYWQGELLLVKQLVILRTCFLFNLGGTFLSELRFGYVLRLLFGHLNE